VSEQGFAKMSESDLREWLEDAREHLKESQEEVERAEMTVLFWQSAIQVAERHLREEEVQEP
jgi:hypothetical protein